MGKREVVNVNEDIIKKMIAGDIPTHSFDQLSQQDSSLKKETVKETDADMKEENIPKATRKKKPKNDYQNLFLVRQPNSSHRQTSIILGEDVYSSIQKILKVADSVSLANFVNNVLRQHFIEYKDEIMELRRNFMSDLFENE